MSRAIAIAALLFAAGRADADVYKVFASRGELAESSHVPCEATVKTQLRAFVAHLKSVTTTKDVMVLNFTDYEQSSDDYFGSEPKYGYFHLGNKKTALMIVITGDDVLDVNLVSHEGAKACYEKWEGAVTR